MNAFSIKKPTSTVLPLVFDSPHSGTQYPGDFHYACDFKILETAEDKYVDELFAAAPDHGASLLTANFPRSYIDLNRAENDIDPELLSEDWSGPFEISPTSRSHAGIGLIRRLVKPGIPVYERPLTSGEITARIEKYYRPYHDTLENLLKEAHYNYGQVWHINCHSMPNASAYPRRGLGLVGNRAKPVDFCIGDRDGRSCAIGLTRSLRDFIRDMGYTVSLNDPFKGLELVEKYSNPAQGYHALQIEINKSLYMNEETGEKTKNYSALKADIEKVIHFTATFVQNRLTTLAAD
jgi:N-formylglutamate amidohydrolase